ncbi:MAG: hypothetical protein ACSHW0_07995 [Thalassotalea sp.]
MLKIKAIFYIAVLCLTLFLANKALALDIIKITDSESILKDKRSAHKNEVIKRSLELTIPEYGPYEFRRLDINMNRHRALPVVIKGEISNIYISAASDEWNKKTLAIKIPIRRGLLNYRLLLIHKADLALFSQVETLADLKQLTAGVRNGWVTTEVFKYTGMELVATQNFNGLFSLLNAHRFNYIPRAIYEVFDELAARQHLIPNVVIEPRLVLHLPMPTYVYISPTYPRIAQRIEKGLTMMLDNGELDQILRKYYADDIKRADLKNRKVINIDNPYYTDKALLADQALWYQM